MIGAQAATLIGTPSADRWHSCHARQMTRTRCRLSARIASRRVFPTLIRRARYACASGEDVLGIGRWLVELITFW